MVLYQNNVLETFRIGLMRVTLIDSEFFFQDQTHVAQGVFCVPNLILEIFQAHDKNLLIVTE